MGLMVYLKIARSGEHFGYLQKRYWSKKWNKGQIFIESLIWMGLFIGLVIIFIILFQEEYRRYRILLRSEEEKFLFLEKINSSIMDFFGKK
jgi:hypothetical protein